MTDEQAKLETDAELQTGYNKSTNETFSPVIVTEGIGTIFLGVISIVLMVVVGGLLMQNRRLEDQLRKSGS